ncbi:MAG: 2-phosphosulfolactate phosphatase [Verrucomicrobiales bacterium]|nr:2-phosphosulfolactate phosphatase [Verrucomicrobiales bacterium]
MKDSTLEVILSPAEFAPLAKRDLSQAVCVVFDILRATTSMVTALSNGAEAIIPVAEISEALAIRHQQPEVLLAGERDGFRIGAKLTGSIDFDLGNSPREFTAEKVQGRRIAMTTTNGTRALRACAGGKTVLASSFLNLEATRQWILKNNSKHLILVCSGTQEEPALEDILAAGALCQGLWDRFIGGLVSDAAEVARNTYETLGKDLPSALQSARNGRRLLSIPELREDVSFCVQRNTHAFCAKMDSEGIIWRIS